MPEAIIITPVKDSIDTTLATVKSIYSSNIDFEYFVFNDFSSPESKKQLEISQKQYGFNLIHLEEVTDNPSPNYKLVLQMAQSISIGKKLPLIIIESDVIIKYDTVGRLVDLGQTKENPALIGAITINNEGNYNFPYNYVKTKSSETIDTLHSLSFCCTLLTNEFLNTLDFKSLSEKKDWFDVYISRRAKKAGFKNYLAKGVEVLHLPHSSRPWKNLKYTNPFLYYFNKLVKKRDRI